MFSLIRALPLSSLILQQAPAFGLSLIIAEMFYKLGSFTLEAIAFLGTWFVVDAVISFVRGRFRSQPPSSDRS